MRDLDILADIPDGHGRRMHYSELAARARDLDLSGIVVQVAALEDVRDQNHRGRRRP